MKGPLQHETVLHKDTAFKHALSMQGLVEEKSGTSEQTGTY